MGKTLVEPDISRLNDFLAKSFEDMVADYLGMNAQERKDLLNAISKTSKALAEPSFTSWKLHRQQLRFLEREKDHVLKDLLGSGKLVDYLQTFINEEHAIDAALRWQGQSEEEQINIVQHVKADWHQARRVIRWSSDIALFLKSDIEGMLVQLRDNFTTKQSRQEWRDVVNRYIKENGQIPPDAWNTLNEAYDLAEKVINDPKFGTKTWLHEYLKGGKEHADLRQKIDQVEQNLETCRQQSYELEPCRKQVEKLLDEVKTLGDKIVVHEKTIAEQDKKINQLQAYAPIILEPLNDAARVELYETYQSHYIRSVDR